MKPLSYIIKEVSPVYKLGLLERRGDVKKKIVLLMLTSYYIRKTSVRQRFIQGVITEI